MIGILWLSLLFFALICTNSYIKLYLGNWSHLNIGILNQRLRDIVFQLTCPYS